MELMIRRRIKGSDRSLCIFKFQLMSFSLALYLHEIYKQSRVNIKRALPLLCNDYTSTYDSLLAKTNKSSMEIKRYRTQALEIFEILSNLNPTYMQDLFCLRSSTARRPNDIAVVRTNTNTHGTKSLRSLGPQVWNSLPEPIKAITSLAHFRSLINTWFGKECLSNLCKNTITSNPTNY